MNSIWPNQSKNKPFWSKLTKNEQTNPKPAAEPDWNRSHPDEASPNRKHAYSLTFLKINRSISSYFPFIYKISYYSWPNCGSGDGVSFARRKLVALISYFHITCTKFCPSNKSRKDTRTAIKFLWVIKYKLKEDCIMTENRPVWWGGRSGKLFNGL